MDGRAAPLSSVFSDAFMQGPRCGADVSEAARGARYLVYTILPVAQRLFPCWTGWPDAASGLKLPWADDIEEGVGSPVDAYVDAFLLERLPDPPLRFVPEVREVDVMDWALSRSSGSPVVRAFEPLQVTLAVTVLL